MQRELHDVSKTRPALQLDPCVTPSCGEEIPACRPGPQLLYGVVQRPQEWQLQPLCLGQCEHPFFVTQSALWKCWTWCSGAKTSQERGLEHTSHNWPAAAAASKCARCTEFLPR